jgi:hypothetical protein
MRGSRRHSAARAAIATVFALWFHVARAGATYEVIPYTGSVPVALAQSAAGKTVPMSSFTQQATKTGKSYTDTIIGVSPFATTKTITRANILIVPLIIDIGSTVFDPTATETCTAPNMAPTTAIMQSPLFNKVLFDGKKTAEHGSLINGVDLGLATYIDAFQRAEFWSVVQGTQFHLVLTPTLAAPYTISAAIVQSLEGRVEKTACAPQGYLNKTNFQNYLLNTLLKQEPGVTPTSFVLFVTKNVALSNSLACPGCTRGFHSAVNGKAVQTFGFADYETTELYPGVVDIDTLSHEIAEWVDDPLGKNQTPPWGHVGQQKGCQHNWEVGDPLSGTNFPSIKMTNGMTYHPQELAFYSWYYNAPATASIGAGGAFSSNGTFTTPAPVCKT